MKLNVFTDFHHASLLNSLIMLFEDRLGGQVFRPIGREWFDQGYWKIYDHPATVEQYLGINGATPDGSQPLNDTLSGGGRVIDFNHSFEYYNCRDIESDEFNKAITLPMFMKVPIDVVIASIPEHIEPFRRLANSHPSKPKLIYQIGNSWDIDLETTKLVDGIMSSAKTSTGNRQKWVPYIEYHQEFSLDTFSPDLGPLTPLYTIYSFVNCFNIQDHFKSDWALFQEIQRMMPEWHFKSYGGGCRDGAAHGTRELSEKMKESRFIWHTKNGGDGYGHVIHNAAAVGRPLIVKKSYYSGRMAEALLIDGETCIDIDNLSSGQIVDKIIHYSEAGRYNQMRKNIYNTFKSVVDFDAEEIKIREFLNQIIYNR